MKKIIFILFFFVPGPDLERREEYLINEISKTILHINPEVSGIDAYRYAKSIYREGLKEDINPALIAAIIQVESEFKKNAVGQLSNDFGPMQVNEFWLKKLKISKKDLLNIDQGIAFGVKILAIKRREMKDTGCWWSVYNSRKVEHRSKYEMRVNKVVGRIDLWFDCAGVKSQDLTNFSAWEARTLASRRLGERGISATKTSLPMRLVVNNMGPDQALGRARNLVQFRD